MKIMLPGFGRVIKKRSFYLGAGLMLVALLAIYSIILLNQKTCYNGVYIDGLNLGGLDKADAISFVYENAISKTLNQTVLLRYGNLAWTLKPNEISLQYQSDEALEHAYKIGRTGNVFFRLYEIAKLRFVDVHLKSQPYFDSEQLTKILADIKIQIDKDCSSAYVLYDNESITIGREVIGEHLDVEENIQVITEKILSENSNEIYLIVNRIFPDISYNDIKDINHVVSSFETNFNPRDENRTHNVQISCDKINGIILLPGDTFSMNRALGPRTPENGYMESKIVYKNEYIDGIGGGVCQTTTTLYNTVLKSKLEVLERAHHSLPSLYVEPGLDATIAGDYIDFKFQNNKDYPVCISAEVNNNRIITRILGKKENNNYRVKLVSVIVEEYEPGEEEIIIDNNIPDGEKVIVTEPRKGFKVIVYRDTYDDKGNRISREIVSKDTYKPVNAQIKVNENYNKEEADLIN